MIEKRLVQWYAADAGVDLDIAEREVTLTYVLRILADQGLLQTLAFKGGTAIRKLYLGGEGRFSLDLDFTAIGDVDPETLILDIVESFHDRTHFGLAFTIPSANYYANPDSCGAEVTYQHDWVTNGRFGIQVSFRAQPLLPVKSTLFLRERYFDWLGIEPPVVPSLDLHEIIGEKVRAAVQRSRVRDLYDLYQLANHRFDRDLVRKIAVIKCWETNFAFNPATFLEGISGGYYDWSDLRRLVRRGWEIPPETIINGVRKGYAFLGTLTPEEALLASDPYSRQQNVYCQFLELYFRERCLNR
jgi:predicted nucleotidyltransferase component of viral defense system